MSILIKGLNMPRDIAPNVHQTITLVIGSNGLVYEVNRNRLPAVAVKVPEPHGRLIDADVIDGRVSVREDGFKGETHDVLTQVRGLIATTPTVIEAEDKE